MRKQPGGHHFKDPDKMLELNNLLTKWLDPNAPNTKVIDGVAPTFGQLALWLSAHFEVPAISEGTVRNYVHTLISKGNDHLKIRKRGRLTTTNKQHEPVLQSGRPRTPKKENLKSTKALGRKSVRRESHSPDPETSLQTLLAIEAIHLTGLTRSALHKTLSANDTLKKSLVCRSSFFSHLKTQLDATHLHKQKSVSRRKGDIHHSLRLHQVTLRTSDGPWCAFLFGYEPRSQFLNAACFIAHPKNFTNAAANPADGPTAQPDSSLRATLVTNNDLTALQLPAKALNSFITKTEELMALPVDTVHLSSALGSPTTLTSHLKKLAPEKHFVSSQSSHQPFTFILPDAGKSIEALRKQLKELLNSHHREVASMKLKKRQKSLDPHIEKFFRVELDPSDSQKHKYIAQPTPIAAERTAKKRAERLQAKKLVALRRVQANSTHAQFRLRIPREDIVCDGH